MTVQELIHKLKSFPPDYLVECANYEEDCYGKVEDVIQGSGPNWDLDSTGKTVNTGVKYFPIIEIHFK